MAQQYNEPNYGEPQPVTPNPEEPKFMVEGKEVLLSQLPPDVIKKWYEAETNRAKWQKANTDRAEEIAAQRKQLEGFGDLDEVGRQVQQYQELLKYFQEHPQLEQQMLRFMQANPIGSPQQNPGNPVDPQIMQLITEQKKQIEELTKQVSTITSEGEKRTINEERETAFKALLEREPELNREEFQKFVDEQVESAGDMTNLYMLIRDAQIGRNKEQIQQEAQKQTLQNIQDRSQVVDTGKGAPETDIPKNVDLTKSMDEIFDDFAKETGNEEQPTIIEE